MTHYGDEFQRLSKYTPENLPRVPLDWAHKPATYKHYPDAPVVPLPTPDPKVMGNATLGDLLLARRSVRNFTHQPLTLEQLSWLLWAANGITRREDEFAFRTAPSAGALYPVETYLIAHRIVGMEPGLYHYGVLEHQLHTLHQGDLRRTIAQGALGQDMAATAAAVFIWTAVFPRAQWKYRQRAYRYVYLDAGHIAQNLALACVALNLGGCQIAALFDDTINQLLGVDGTAESVLYLTALGHPASPPV